MCFHSIRFKVIKIGTQRDSLFLFFSQFVTPKNSKPKNFQKSRFGNHLYCEEK